MKLNKKKKKIIAITAAGTIGLAILTIPTVALVGCATTSDPYGPYTNVEATTPISGTSPLLMNYATNQQGDMTAVSSSGGMQFASGLGVKTSIMASQIGGWIGDGLNTKIVNDQTTPDSTYDVTIGKKSVPINVQEMINYYNSINLSTTISTTIISLLKNVVTFDTLPQPMGFGSGWNGTQVSQWNNKIEQGTNPSIGKAFTEAMTLGAGVGANTYSLWPSSIQFSWSIVPASEMPLFSTPSTSGSSDAKGAVAAQSEQTTKKATTIEQAPTGLPNAGQAYDINSQDTLNYTLEVKNVNVYYSWYQKLKTGGDWVQNINEVNDAMTLQQKQILAKTLDSKSSTDTYQNLTYKIAMGNLDFNINPEYNEQSVGQSTGKSGSGSNIVLSTDAKSTSKVKYFYTGIGSIAVPVVPSSSKPNSTSITSDKSSTSSSNNSQPTFSALQNASYFTVANSNSKPLINLQNFESFAKLLGFNFMEGSNDIQSMTDKPIFNNYDNIPFEAYRIMWLIGALSNEQNNGQNSLKNIESSSAYEDMMKNSSTINAVLTNDSAGSKAVSAYLNDQNYQTGLDILYNILNIGTIQGLNQYPNNVLNKDSNPWVTPKTNTSTQPAKTNEADKK